MSLTPELICSAIHKGTRRAFNQYEHWTGGEWLYEAPEYLLTTYIGESLGKLDGNHYVYLEYNVESAMKEAGGRGRGKLSRKIRPHGRADLLILNGNGQPYGVIEVKRIYNRFYSLKNDISRIEEILKRESTVKFGCVSVYLDRGALENRSAKSRLVKSLDTIKQKFEDRRQNWEFQEKIHSHDGDAWASFVDFIRN